MRLVKRLPLSAWVHFLATLPWFDPGHPNGALCQLSLLNGNRKLVRQPTSQRPHHEDPQPSFVTWLTSRYGPRSLKKKLWICPTCCFSNMCNIQPKPTTWFKLLMLRGIQKTVDGPWLSQRGWSYTFEFTTIPVTVDYPRGSPRGRSWRSYNLHWWFYGLKFTTIRATVDNPRGSPRGRSWRSYIPHPTNQERS